MMNQTVNFDHLPRYQPRKFVPANVDMRKEEQITALYALLIEREINSVDAFEQWVFDCSELASVIDQTGSVLYIKMTCHTDNSEFVENYKDFIQNIVPQIKPLSDELNHKFLELNQRFPLDANRYRVFERNLKTEVDLFHQENVPLETDVQLLSQEYQSIFGVMTVHFEDREQTLPQMSRYQFEADRQLREQAWIVSAQRRMQDAERLENIFETMLGLRDMIARNAGYANFRDYQFKAFHRFDYSPEHCKRYHTAVRRCVVPLWKKILNRRQEQLGVQELRPWDLSVDPFQRPALRPFSSVEQLVSGVEKIFERIYPEFGRQFRDMASLGLLDLESRKGKAPGGYQNTLAESRKPFIFMNAVGIDGDVHTLLHEGGHAFHSLACAHDPLHAYRHAPMEFCEVASMSMELLGGSYLDVFYNEEDHKRSVRDHLEGIVHILCWVANIDAFQHWVYEHPGHTRDERSQKWLELHQDFSSLQTDWNGLEHYRESLWHRQLHIFEVPFYYIEYGIAQLGALQIWHNAKENQGAAIEKYKQALSLGGSRTLPELFATAGIEFDFSEKTIVPLVEMLARELELS